MFDACDCKVRSEIPSSSAAALRLPLFFSSDFLIVSISCVLAQRFFFFDGLGIIGLRNGALLDGFGGLDDRQRLRFLILEIMVGFVAVDFPDEVGVRFPALSRSAALHQFQRRFLQIVQVAFHVEQHAVQDVAFSPEIAF